MEESNKTLLVRHLPSELTNQEKIDLLCHFGAECARPMGVKGPMKHTAFAKFETKELAEQGLRRLHQLEVLGCKLVVEFAKNANKSEFPTGTSEEKVSKISSESDSKESVKSEKKKSELREQRTDGDPFLIKQKIPYPKKPTLYYRYPPPTVSTLANIANAMASHPKFYTQVLHLMNKMNLPCPFGPVTPSPPIALDSHQSSHDQKIVQEYSGNFGEIEEVEMEEEESELESDDEMPLSKENSASVKMRKRPRKRMRLVKPDMSMVMKPLHIPKPDEVFENIDERKSSQIVFNIAGTEKVMEHRLKKKETLKERKEESSNLQVVEGGFGKVEPVAKPAVTTEIQKTDANYKLDPSDYFTAEKVAAGRLKPDQMKEFSVFKNYSRGDTTCRLYIKNLTKQVTEQDLVNLFGSFVDWHAENAVDAFDVRLMKEGRMKGQCFVTLPDEGSAVRILDSCNGYVLNNKPVVIQFARSARAKEVDKPIE